MAVITNAVKPAEYAPSAMCNPCEKHFYEVKGMKAVDISKLFPSMKPAIYLQGGDLDAIEKHTREALKNVDMSMIKPDDRVNITCSEHGFGIMGGLPYMRMIKTILDVIAERTGNYRSRVVMAMYRLANEADEVKEYYDLENYWDCEVKGTSSLEETIPIETEIGTFYGVKDIYDCDHMIYAYYDDPREQYVHRGTYRLLKSFTMNFGGVETRCSFHQLSSGNARMAIPKAIYDSEFVQNLFAFACIMNTNPNGVYDIFAHKSLYECEKYTDINMLRDYSYIRRLFNNIGPWIAVADGGKWMCYLHAAGQVFGCCKEALTDFYDLDMPWVNMSAYPPKDPTGTIPQMNVKVGDLPTFMGCVDNQDWIGLQMGWFMMHGKFYCVGKEHYELIENDRCNQGKGPGTRMADMMVGPIDTLEEAMSMAEKDLGCSNFIAFDGCFGYINCSPSAAEDIVRAAEGVEDQVYDYDMPKYLRQRCWTEDAIRDVYENYYHRELKG